MSLPVPRLKKMVELTLKSGADWNGINVRNSDIALMLVIWSHWFNVSPDRDTTIHVRRLFDLPREDNIKRVRAYFQNVEGKYLPTDWKVAKKRGIERERWEAGLGYKEPAAAIQQAKISEAELDKSQAAAKAGDTEPPKLFDLPTERHKRRII